MEIKHGCLDRKLLVTLIENSVIRILLPPQTATREDCDKAYEILKLSAEDVYGMKSGRV
jgi:4-aminobutyrate aminotransferase and related aminotransferases